MEFSSSIDGREDEIIKLFASVFGASEGEDEGELIGALAKDLLNQTPKDDLFVFIAEDETEIVGCIMFSRLNYSDDPRIVFLLSPVAVASKRQGQRIGQRLLSHGLASLKDAGVDVAMTYGDPNYYARVGFHPVDEAFAAPPQKLQYPHGWLGQTLNGDDFAPLKGVSTCVAALDNPAYW